MSDTTNLVGQLRALALLTQTEAQVAQIRVGQARTDAVRRELTQNGENAVQRTALLRQAVRDLGGLPDVVSPAIGRLTGVVKATVEQPQPLDEALLGDLALEHQLLDRARYVKVLAEAAGERAIVKLADTLITAHSATVQWLTIVLAEYALGGPAALRATPIQRVAGGASRVANLPVRYATDTVNRTVQGVQQTTEQTRIRLTAVADKASQFTGAVRESLAVGRNASLERGEKIARSDGDTDAAEAIHQTRRQLGALSAAELPIKHYETLSVSDAAKAVKGLKQVEDVRAVIAYEEAHSDRSGVINAAQTRVAAIAKEAVGIA
ncbi:ferritin-like domain-containing protein [uncultured Jatrophihabitans sp.]|uniref:ferritin-like domain-containing protein n=1 Tax=uncultured Jatrophihabitans sp. TaxID=1610747 RepID=UPI0035CBD004